MSVQAAMNNLAMSGLGFTRGFTKNVLGLDTLKKEEKKPDDNKTSNTEVNATEETTATTDTPTAIEAEGIKPELEELDEREAATLQEQTKKIETQKNQKDAMKERAEWLKSLSTKEMAEELHSRGHLSGTKTREAIHRESKGGSK
jgi:hypothetical protein